ncbi:MAG TPA: hypothetical protein VFE58_09155 [Tepidisphaeraceae bacterium]|jgi:hypothetical protein|nr:hypothetical protein [Tepidisphaeraceae bacterium]
MIQHDLKISLKQADAAFSAPPLQDPTTLARRVQQTSRNRSSFRALAAVLITVGIGTLTLHRPSHLTVSTATDPRADLQNIRHEIAMHEQTTRDLLQAEHLEHTAGRIAIARELSTGRTAAERAASALLWQAEHESLHPGQSLRAYSDVVHYFPDTFSANIARQRLQQLQKEG